MSNWVDDGSLSDVEIRSTQLLITPFSLIYVPTKMPPSTRNVTPLMKLASSLASHR